MELKAGVERDLLVEQQEGFSGCACPSRKSPKENLREAPFVRTLFTSTRKRIVRIFRFQMVGQTTWPQLVTVGRQTLLGTSNPTSAKFTAIVSTEVREPANTFRCNVAATGYKTYLVTCTVSGRDLSLWRFNVRWLRRGTKDTVAFMARSKDVVNVKLRNLGIEKPYNKQSFVFTPELDCCGMTPNKSNDLSAQPSSSSSPLSEAKLFDLKCSRDLVPGVVTVLLRTLGHHVGRHPRWFIAVTTTLSVVLGASVFWTLDYRTSIEELYIPFDAQSWADRDVADHFFPMNFSGKFQPDRATSFGSYGLILVYPKDGGSILRRECFDEVLVVDTLARNISVQVPNAAGNGTDTLRYTDLCARWNDDCFSSETMKLDNVVDKIEAGLVKLTWPLFFDEDAFAYIILPGSIGKPVMVDEVVVSTPAVGLYFILAAGSEEELRRGIRWEEQFLQEIGDISRKLEKVDVYYETKVSVEYEFDGLKKYVPRQGFLAGTVVLVFSVFCCMMADWVRAKPWLGVVGVVSTVLAIVASYGFLSLVGFPFTTTLLIVPFLMLGIGMEDTFLMLTAWRKTDPGHPVEKRVEETYAEAAVSMTITSVTNLLSFLIGATSSFRVLNVFCVYSGVSILFLYIYQITFYGGWLAICGHLEAENRHSLTGAPVIPLSEARKLGKSRTYQLFCTGGHSPEEKADGDDEKAKHAVMHFFREEFATAITKPWVEVIVFLGYLVYLGFGIYGCLQLNEGLSLKRLVSDDSYYVSFYDKRYDDFMDYPYRVPIVVAGHLDYSNQTVQDDIERLIDRVESYKFYAKGNYTDSWLRRYVMFVGVASKYTHIDISNETSFNSYLKEFLQDNVNALDVVFDDENRIIASRFIVQIQNLTGLEDAKDCMLFLRKLFAEEFPQYNVTAYAPVFAFGELLIGATRTAMSTVSMAAVVMLLVALIMIPESKCAIYVGISLVSIELGVLGYMSLWGVNLDCVSVGCLVMCIGFSVDFSAHVTHSFIAAPGDDTMTKLRDAVESAGLPILQGAASCVLAVVAMVSIPAYVFGIFVKTMFLVMLFGAAHGILLLPILLLHTAGPRNRRRGGGGSKPELALVPTDAAAAEECNCAQDASVVRKSDLPKNSDGVSDPAEREALLLAVDKSGGVGMLSGDASIKFIDDGDVEASGPATDSRGSVSRAAESDEGVECQ